jgi:hypothetical protein
MKRLILTLVLILGARPTLAADAPASQPASAPTLHATIEPGLYWNLLRTEQFAIGIPQKWSNLPPRPNMVLFIAKQGIKDETRQPLDVGLSIERLSKPADSLDEEAKKLIQRYSEEKSVQLDGKPTAEHLKLSDGSDSVLVSLSIHANGRRTYMQKLLVSGKEHRWVISGYITAGEKSILPKSDSDMARKIRAHLQTFTLDPNKIDQNPLNRAYLTPQQTAPPASQPSGK